MLRPVHSISDPWRITFRIVNMKLDSHSTDMASQSQSLVPDQEVRFSPRLWTGWIIPSPVEVQMSFDKMIEAIAQSQDKSAFTKLFEHFAPRLKSYVMRLGADDRTAEEVSQEAMLTVWRKADRFDRRQAAASTWIFTIARNKRIDRLRRERRPEFDPKDPTLVAEAPELADREIERTEINSRLQTNIAKLPPEQAAMVRSAFYEDKSHGTIAVETGLPLGTVKSRIRLALRRLAGEVEDLE